MEERNQKNTKKDTVLWIDRKNRILSFHKADGFEKRVFDSHSKTIAFACELVAMGFRIQ